jgi:hypothetical protein
MKVIERAIDIFGVIFDPRFWLRNYPTCHAYSHEIEALMDEGVLPTPRCIKRGGVIYTVMFGGVEIWIENWAYGFGAIYPNGECSSFTMRRRTALRFRRLLKQEGIIGKKPYVSPFKKEMET